MATETRMVDLSNADTIRQENSKYKIVELVFKV